jgi:TonB family protein
MKDERKTQPHSIDKHQPAAQASEDWSDNPLEDQELRPLLMAWRVPHTPSGLDRRVIDAYRQEVTRAPLWRRILTNYFPIPTFKSSPEVVTMKRCSTCQEEFADKFSFCPIDGTPLNELAAAIVASPLPANAAPMHDGEERMLHASPVPSYNEYHLTIIEDAGLTSRLMKEVREAAHQSQLTWPEFKRDPVGFSKRSVTTYSLMTWRFISTPNVAIGISTALLLVLSVCIMVVAYDRYRAAHTSLEADNVREDLEYLGEYKEIPEEQEKPDKGTAGMNKGNGGGSKPKFEKPQGGGGGGREELKPASYGKLPQASLTVPQIVAPDSHPPVIKNPSLPVAATIVADPMLFPPDTRPIAYGDPKSKSTETSSGPGTGNGIGVGTGGGVGSGEGGGVGPGRGGNTGGNDFKPGGGGPGGGGGGRDTIDYTKPFSPKDVTQKARIISRPEPQYTEEARKNQISGTVVLRAVLGSNGAVTGIRAVSGLPFGLTEKAIAAAHQIKFVPAQKDGHAVSQYIQIEYNFNLY